MRFRDIDKTLIATSRKLDRPLARGALFVVYFWFGALKLVDASPASPMIAALLQRTMPFIAFESFILVLGLYEMTIGILFLIPRMERLVMLLLFLHLIVTALPLILLPALTWRGIFIPTLEGQYIIKNLAIVALALTIVSHLRPMRSTKCLLG